MTKERMNERVFKKLYVFATPSEVEGEATPGQARLLRRGLLAKTLFLGF